MKPFTQEMIEAGQQSKKANRERRVAQAAATVDELVRLTPDMPGWALAHAAKARKGNVRSLVALKCADCVAFERVEIARCEITACTLHSLRPYQSREGAAVGDGETRRARPD